MRKKKIKINRQPRPLVLEQAYGRELIQIAKAAHNEVVKLVVPALSVWGIHGARMDAAITAQPFEGQLNKAVFQAFTPELLAKVSAVYAEKVSGFQKKALTSQLSKAVGVGFFLGRTMETEEVDKTIDAWVKDNVDLIKTIPSKYLASVRNMVEKSVEGGMRVEDLAKKIEEHEHVATNRAKLIARDQVTKLYGRLNQERQQSLGLDRYRWRGVLDEAERPMHRNLEGQIFSWDDPPETNEEGETNNPGEDIQCFTGDSKIESPSLNRKFFRRWFSGKLTEIITKSGKCLSVTGNHPILTLRGWIKAKDVKLSDYLIHASFKNRSSSCSDVNDSKASFEKAFNLAFLPGLMMRIAGRVSQFHSDGSVKEYVDIISLKRCLPFYEHFKISEIRDNSFFSNSHKTWGNFRLPGFCNFLSMLKRIVSPTHGLMGFADKGFTFSRGHKLLSLIHGSRPITEFNAIELEKACKSWAREAETNNQSRQTKSAIIKPEKIRSIRSRQFDGHVFNLENEKGWYSCNGYIIHNCRCTAEPYLDDL